MEHPDVSRSDTQGTVTVADKSHTNNVITKSFAERAFIKLTAAQHEVTLIFEHWKLTNRYLKPQFLLRRKHSASPPQRPVG
jgi:hypothetical protein